MTHIFQNQNHRDCLEHNQFCQFKQRLGDRDGMICRELQPGALNASVSFFALLVVFFICSRLDLKLENFDSKCSKYCILSTEFAYLFHF